MANFLIFLLAFLGLFISIDFLQKKVFCRFQWSRKATHILSGILIWLMPIYLNQDQIIILAIIFSIVLAVSKRKHILSLHNVERLTLGEVFYPLSMLFLALMCLPEDPEAFQLSALVLAFSDGFTGLVGEIWNFCPVSVFGTKHKKSLGGAITFFIVTLLIFIGFHGISVPEIFILIGVSLILTAVEFFLVFGFDNLALPLLAAVIELFIIK